MAVLPKSLDDVFVKGVVLRYCGKLECSTLGVLTYENWDRKKVSVG